MISFCEAVEIAADKERVWRALTLPDEVIRWDTGIVESLDAPSDYPLPGQHVRWRYRFGPFPLTLHDRPSEVVACSRLRTSIRLGFFDFDEIYMLSESESSGTRLEAELFLSSRIPVVGRLLECVVGVPLSRSTVRTSLVAIRAHCERAP